MFNQQLKKIITLTLLAAAFKGWPLETADEPAPSPFYVEELISSLLSVEHSVHRQKIIERVLKKDESSGMEVINFLITQSHISAREKFFLVDMAWSFSKDRKNIKKLLNTLTNLSKPREELHLHPRSLIPRGAVLLGGSEGLEILENGLSASYPPTRKLSARGFALVLENSSALKQLRLFSKDSDWNIRAGAAEGVSLLKRENSLRDESVEKKAIIRRLKNDDDYRVRESLIRGMVERKQYHLLGLVLDAFTYDASVDVRRLAAAGAVFLNDHLEIEEDEIEEEEHFEIEEENASDYPENKSKKRVLLERLSKDFDFWVRYDLALRMIFLRAGQEQLTEDILFRLAEDKFLGVARQAVKTALLRADLNSSLAGRAVIRFVENHPFTGSSRLGKVNFARDKNLFKNEELWLKKLSKAQEVLLGVASYGLDRKTLLTALKILSSFYQKNESADKELKMIASSSRHPVHPAHSYPRAVKEVAQKILKNNCSSRF